MFTLLRLIFLPVRVGVGTTKLGVKAGYHAGRLVGYRRIVLFGLGVGVGLLVAPMTGREARAKLQSLIEQRRSGGRTGDLAERVRYELSNSPRTWHLPQPFVEVHGGTAILRGEVPHETGRVDLERTAAAVAGVVAVENHVAISRPVEADSPPGTNGRH
ncbi:MAG: BON domain-containing protein [Acidimicrobiales bacterium]